MIPVWIYAAVAAVLLAMGFGSGYKVESWHRDSLEQAAIQKAEKQVEAEATKQAAASQALETTKEQAHVQYVTITKTVDKIVERPVYRNVCLDPDGLRAANAAIRGQAADPGKPDAALPGPKRAP